MYPIINIFGREIGTYALLSVIGILLCGFLGGYFAKSRYKIMYEDIVLLMLAIGGGILAGGHLLYGITNLDCLIADFKITPINLKNVINILAKYFGGNVFYGGLLGSIAVVYVYTHFSKALNRKEIFDIYAVCIPLFHCFGRIGCFLGGCCYGTESKFGFIAPENKYVPELDDVRRFPVALLEAFLNLCIFALLITLFKKEKLKGNLILVYLFTYGIVRFCTEFLRGDEIRGRVLCFSTSQWISLGLIAFVLIRVAYLKKKNKCIKQ